MERRPEAGILKGEKWIWNLVGSAISFPAIPTWLGNHTNCTRCITRNRFKKMLFIRKKQSTQKNCTISNYAEFYLHKN